MVAAFASVGVPDNTPVDELKVNPAGNAGAMTKYSLLKPVSVYAVVAVIAAPTRPVTVCEAGEMVAVPVTVMVMVAVADVAPSVAVTVYVAATAAAVGVPVTTPVDVLSERPAGSDGEMANTRVPVMPVDVYAVVAVIAVPTVALTVWAAGVSVVFADTLSSMPCPSACILGDAISKTTCVVFSLAFRAVTAMVLLVTAASVWLLFHEIIQDAFTLPASVGTG